MSVSQMMKTMPLKKKERPTVTMMTAKIGSPIIFLRKMRSVRRPSISPIIMVPIRAKINA